MHTKKPPDPLDTSTGDTEKAEDPQKEFKCDQCGHQTSHRNSARRHSLIHSGERPYKCPECEYSCIQSNSFRAHLEKTHPDLARELISKCALCPFTTINSRKLQLHMKTKHANTVVPE